MFIDKLPEGITMQLCLRPDLENSLSGKILFSSSKRWLHPLFELGEFLSSHAKGGSNDNRIFEFDDGIRASSSDLFLRDRVIGRAAAFLILRMGLHHVETDLVSQRALPLLVENAVTIEAFETIDVTKCITEELLKDKFDTEEAYLILSKRRAKALEQMRR
jgi:hypothetical protein